jgi:hypothetical protein
MVHRESSVEIQRDDDSSRNPVSLGVDKSDPGGIKEGFVPVAPGRDLLDHLMIGQVQKIEQLPSEQFDLGRAKELFGFAVNIDKSALQVDLADSTATDAGLYGHSVCGHRTRYFDGLNTPGLTATGRKDQAGGPILAILQAAARQPLLIVLSADGCEMLRNAPNPASEALEPETG